MTNGDGFLNIKVDLKQWMEMSEEKRTEHTFYALQYLTKEAGKNKLVERLLTFGASLLASLSVLAPLVWWAVSCAQKAGG